MVVQGTRPSAEALAAERHRMTIRERKARLRQMSDEERRAIIKMPVVSILKGVDRD